MDAPQECEHGCGNLEACAWVTEHVEEQGVGWELGPVRAAQVARLLASAGREVS